MARLMALSWSRQSSALPVGALPAAAMRASGMSHHRIG
jgi:hypothetical protein